MKNILISGLVNTETTVRVRQFPIEYYPIDYPFFGVDTAASGVAFNLACALSTLGDRVTLLSMTGNDFAASYISNALQERGIATDHIKRQLQQTPSSVVLYDGTGKRQIYCDLKDIQQAQYSFNEDLLASSDIVIACNTNFNRPLLQRLRAMGKTVATDVHVLTDIHNAYNRDFMEAANILFLSDEGIGEDYASFLWELAHTYHSEVIVLGRGSRGAAMYLRSDDTIRQMPAASVGPVVNTVGAGDALFASFIHYYSGGVPAVEALQRAQIFAAAKIRVSGAAQGFVTEQEIEQWMVQ